MHAERLQSIFLAITMDDAAQNYTGLIQNIVVAVNARINEPNEPQQIQNIADSVKKFREAAKVSETKKFSVTWKKIIFELSLQILLIEDVEHRIDDIFRSTSLEADLVVELNKIVTERNEKKEALSQVVAGFEKIGLNPEQLKPGEIVLYFSIPKDTTKNNLKTFHKELANFEKDLLWISMAITEGSQEFPIKSISSNDFNIVLNINADLGEILLYAIAALQMTLWRISKKDKAASEFSDAPAELRQKMREWVGSLINQNIEDLYNNILNEFGGIINKSEFERNAKKLKEMLHNLAKKLQAGYVFDVNAGEFGDQENDGKASEKPLPKKEIQYRSRINKISQRSAGLRLLQAQESDILALPNPEESAETEDKPPQNEPSSE